MQRRKLAEESAAEAEQSRALAKEMSCGYVDFLLLENNMFVLLSLSRPSGPLDYQSLDTTAIPPAHAAAADAAMARFRFDSRVHLK